MPRVLVRVHRSAAESIDGFRPALPKSRMKRGHLMKEEISFYFRMAFGEGRCGEGKNVRLEAV
jgi:hypothetical protein